VVVYRSLERESKRQKSSHSQPSKRPSREVKLSETVRLMQQQKALTGLLQPQLLGPKQLPSRQERVQAG
jgi:hypothetical protein